MEQTPQYYIDEPHRLDEIDYEDLLLHMEEDPVNTRWVFLTLLKQKYSFGRVDDELVHHLITIENNKNTLQELLKVVQRFPTKASQIDHPAPGPMHNLPQYPDDNGEEGVTTFPVADMPGETTEEEEDTPPESSSSEKEKTTPESEDPVRYDSDIPIPAEPAESTSSATPDWEEQEEEMDEEPDEEEEPDFASWLRNREVLPGTARELRPRKKGVKRKKLGKTKMSKAEKQAARSVEENKELVSETLAHLYVQQELYDKAIEMYGKLKLKFPNKSGYFADKIDQIQKLNS